MKYNLTIFFFHGAYEQHEKLTGFKHNEILEDRSIYSILGIQKRVFESGLNTMLLHQKKNNITLMIDDKNFRQR